MTELPARSPGSAWCSQGWGAVRLDARHGLQVGTWLFTRDTSWPLHDNPRHGHRHYPHLTGERTEAEPVSTFPKSHKQVHGSAGIQTKAWLTSKPGPSLP